MAENAFYRAEARHQTAHAIRAIEAQTSAEVVVSVRPRSGHYRHADYLFGFVCSLIALVVMLEIPQEVPLTVFPSAVLVAFLAGSIVCALTPPLRRLLSGPRLRTRNTRLAARAAFVDQAISRTRGRTGIMVYLSLFERRAEVVVDLGIDPARLGTEWTEAVRALSRSVRQRPDLGRFLAALKAMGPILGRVLPHAADDVNELPDAMDAREADDAGSDEDDA